MVCSLITRKILLLLSKKNTRHFPKANLSLVSAESHPSGEMVTPWTTPQSVECERWSTFHRRIHTKHGESLRYFAHTLFRHIKILIVQIVLFLITPLVRPTYVVRYSFQRRGSKSNTILDCAAMCSSIRLAICFF